MWLFFLTAIATAYAASDLSTELITATEKEGRAVAHALHQYHAKQIEIKDKGINLKDGTMLGGKYTYDLNQLQSRINAAFARLQSRVQAATGVRNDSRHKAELIAIHWRREIYGFGTTEELDQQLQTQRSAAWLLVAFACFLIGSIPKRISKPEQHNTPLNVPTELTKITVPGLSYRVNLVTGLVMDKEMWDEIKTTTTYHHSTFGSQLGETRIESVRKGKAFLLTQDGKEDVLNLTGHGHDYRPGNIVTFLFYGHGKKRNAVAVYNHATENTEEMIGLGQAHGSHWKINLAITCVLAYYAFDWAAAPMRTLGVDHGSWILAQAFAAALVFTGLIHFVNVWRRNRRFRKSYKPKFEKFLRAGDSEIRQTFQQLIGSKSP